MPFRLKCINKSDREITKLGTTWKPGDEHEVEVLTESQVTTLGSTLGLYVTEKEQIDRVSDEDNPPKKKKSRKKKTEED